MKDLSNTIERNTYIVDVQAGKEEIQISTCISADLIVFLVRKF